MNAQYDLVIIGGGSAGLSVAGFARQLGKKVAIVEKSRIGGDCTWTGCVPSKALLKTAKVAHEMRTAERFGLSPIPPKVNLGEVMTRVQQVVLDIYSEETPEVLRGQGIDVNLGGARFLDEHTIMAGETRLEGRTFLIGTGAKPYLPEIPGLNQVRVYTYEDIWELKELPERMLVVGAGPGGSELAQAFQRLGSQVTLLEMAGRVLPSGAEESSVVLGWVFEAEGIDLRLGARVERVWQDGDGIHLQAGDREALGDVLLMTAGRKPYLEGLALEKAGVAYTPEGVLVDDALRTSQRHIYGAGDCIGGRQFTHYAGWQGYMAVRNAFLPGAAQGVKSLVPWTAFTDPEVAQAGMSEAQARLKFGEGVRVCDWPLAQVDRARADGEQEGFIKLVYRNNGKLLGVTIVATRAGEMIQEWILALDRGLKVGDLADSFHVYPSYSMGGGYQAAAQIRVAQLLEGFSGKVIQRLAR